jgi:o-succinylbenzoate synthase
MTYQFKFHRYQRRFRQPLQTSHGVWTIREGIIIQLSDAMGKVGWGEIAPLPWFGSETLEEALRFSQQLNERITTQEIAQISDKLSACQFGFETALANVCAEANEMLQEISTQKLSSFQQIEKRKRKQINYCYLLPAGENAINVWKTLINSQKTLPLPMTFKWKIGVKAIEEEIEIFKKLNKLLSRETKLRLDANGGLNLKQTKQWLKIADETEIIEFIEQPLSPQYFDLMLDLSTSYSTSIALDESVATLNQLENCYQKGWRGIYIIKAAIAGSPKRLQRFCQQDKIDVIFSSVFETKIGREAVLKLAKELSNPNRAIGFGIEHWFEDDE